MYAYVHQYIPVSSHDRGVPFVNNPISSSRKPIIKILNLENMWKQHNWIKNQFKIEYLIFEQQQTINNLYFMYRLYHQRPKRRFRLQNSEIINLNSPSVNLLVYNVFGSSKISETRRYQQGNADIPRETLEILTTKSGSSSKVDIRFVFTQADRFSLNII